MGGARGKKRSTITEMALAAFLERGFANATMDLVATTANVSKATVYAKFSSKDELLAAIVASAACLVDAESHNRPEYPVCRRSFRETCHGQKTSARGFDGYEGDIAFDPDSEIVTAAEVTPGNNDGDQGAGKFLELLANENGHRPKAERKIDHLVRRHGGGRTPRPRTRAPEVACTAKLHDRVSARATVLSVRVLTCCGVMRLVDIWVGVCARGCAWVFALC